MRYNKQNDRCKYCKKNRTVILCENCSRPFVWQSQCGYCLCKEDIIKLIKNNLEKPIEQIVKKIENF